MTDKTLQIKWSELKSQIHHHWEKLTEDELSRLDGGGLEELTVLLRKHYGYGKAQAEIEINKWLRGLELNLKKR